MQNAWIEQDTTHPAGDILCNMFLKHSTYSNLVRLHISPHQVMKLLSFFSAFLLIVTALAVWPRPQNMTIGMTPLRLSSDFSIRTSGIRQVPQDLSDAIHRSSNYLKADKLGALVPDRGASSARKVSSAHSLQSLILSLESGLGQLQSISDGAIAGLGVTDETYTLEIPVNGENATLTARSALGLFRGLKTFEQLWFYIDGTTYTLQAPIQIQDAPAYVGGLHSPQCSDLY